MTEELKEIDKELKKVGKDIDKFNDVWDWDKSYNSYRVAIGPLLDKQQTLSGKKRMLMEPSFKSLPSYGDVMSLADFIETVKSGGFIDSDGSGYYVKDKLQSNISIYPSDVRLGNIRKDFDKIVWYNK